MFDVLKLANWLHVQERGERVGVEYVSDRVHQSEKSSRRIVAELSMP